MNANEKLAALLYDKNARIEQLEADHFSALQLSHEWMRKHDRLLAFIQARPAMLKELIASDVATALARKEQPPYGSVWDDRLGCWVIPVPVNGGL